MLTLFAGPVWAQPTTELSPEHARIRSMVGRWDVRQRIWTGPDAEPTTAPMVARRRLVGGAFLEEVMEPAQGSGQPPFTRTAYFSYNDVRRQYEYIVLDSRAPQMMYETSAGGRESGTREGSDAVWVYLDSFVAPEWGTATNVTFRQRRVTEFGEGSQVMRQYWTPLSAEGGTEFLAVEYVYTRAE